MACQFASLLLALSEEFYVMDAIGRKTLRLPKPMPFSHPDSTPRLPCVANEQQQQITEATSTRSSIYHDRSTLIPGDYAQLFIHTHLSSLLEHVITALKHSTILLLPL